MVEAAVETQLRNIERATGRSIDEWLGLVEPLVAAGDRHGAIVAWLKSEHGLTHGNANLLATLARRAAAPQTDADLLAAQYAGARAPLRDIHDVLVAAATALGEDVTVVVQKTGVALRRHRTFAMIIPSSRTRVDLGLNLGERAAGDRLERTSGMCSHRVRLATVADVDDEVHGWVAESYSRA